MKFTWLIHYCQYPGYISSRLRKPNFFLRKPWVVKWQIYEVTNICFLICFILLGIYSFFWISFCAQRKELWVYILNVLAEWSFSLHFLDLDSSSQTLLEDFSYNGLPDLDISIVGDEPMDHLPMVVPSGVAQSPHVTHQILEPPGVSTYKRRVLIL